MTERLRLWTIIGLLVASVSPMGFAQANGSGKKCLPPQVTYSPDPPPSHYPLKDSVLTVLLVGVDEKGHVVDPHVARSSGSTDFDRDAVSTVKRWRFKPSTCDGKPISVQINIEVHSRVVR